MGRFFSLGGNTAAAVAAVSLLLGTFGATACNFVTGADRLLLASADDDDDDDGTSSSTSSSGNTGGSGGFGSSGSGGTTTTTTSNTSSGGGNGHGGNGEGAGPLACEYPAGPYGVGQGQTVPPNLTWQGYAPNSNSVSTIKIEDFFDCDGTRGIDAVLFDTSQFG